MRGANFLVAKHERSLLCSVCQSVTCWKASGPRLGRTVSVCDVCVWARSGGKIDLKEDDEMSAEEVIVESRDHSAADDEPDASSDEDEEDDEDEDEDQDEDEEIEEDDDEENQVVPWSSGEEVSSSCNGGADRKLKRRRASSDLDSDDEIEDGGGSSSATTQSNRNRATNRVIRLNRFSDRNLREFKPTTSSDSSRESNLESIAFAGISRQSETLYSFFNSMAALAIPPITI